MSQEAEKPKEKKSLNVMLIGQIVFAVVNLAVVGGGAYLVYASTLGWQSPSITEKSLRKPASVAKAKAEAEKAAEGGEKAEGGEGKKEGGEGGEGGGEHAEASSELTPFLEKLDKFTVNLAGEPKRTIRLEVNLEMLNEESFEEVMDISRVPKIRDRIVAVLNDKTFSDLESIQGKLFLKDRITAEVNSILDKGVVKDVYFSDFVVQ